MKTTWFAFGSLLAVALAVPVPSQAANDFFVFKATASIPVVYVNVGMEVDKVLSKTLTTNDVINLALGLPIGTKVDAKKTVLAVAATFDDPGASPLSKLIVYDPSASGIAVVKAVVATITDLDFDQAYLASGLKGQGAAKISLAATTLGTPAQNGFFASNLSGAGTSSGPFAKFTGNYATTIFSASGSSVITGPIKFVNTAKGVTTTYEGFVLKGALTIAGKRLAYFAQ